MASELIVQTIQGPSSGANANKVLIPSGHTLDVSGGTLVPSAGAVVQVLSATKTDTASFTTGSWIDVNGLSVTITPTSASSKILVSCDLFTGINNVNSMYWRFAKNSAPIGVGNSGTILSSGGYYSDVSNAVFSFSGTSGSFLDSPNTTSSVTYNIQVRTYDNTQTGYLNRRGQDTLVGAISTLNIMEIAQ